MSLPLAVVDCVAGKADPRDAMRRYRRTYRLSVQVVVKQLYGTSGVLGYLGCGNFEISNFKFHEISKWNQRLRALVKVSVLWVMAVSGRMSMMSVLVCVCYRYNCRLALRHGIARHSYHFVSF